MGQRLGRREAESRPSGTLTDPLLATGIPHGPCVLFFGCRKESGDFLYRDEWQQFMRSGALSQLVTAFSRDQEAKVYVTHRLREHGADVWRLLQQVPAKQ